MVGILGFIAVFIFAFYAYKTAKDCGRNAWLWAFAVFGVGFGLQVALPFGIGMVLAVVLILTGTPINELQYKVETPATILGIVFLILSFAAMGWMLKKASTVPEIDDGLVDVPPPPTFPG